MFPKVQRTEISFVQGVVALYLNKTRCFDYYGYWGVLHVNAQQRWLNSNPSFDRVGDVNCIGWVGSIAIP